MAKPRVYSGRGYTLACYTPVIYSPASSQNFWNEMGVISTFCHTNSLVSSSPSRTTCRRVFGEISLPNIHITLKSCLRVINIWICLIAFKFKFMTFFTIQSNLISHRWLLTCLESFHIMISL